jgi:PAS domain S-box-containing protein
MTLRAKSFGLLFLLAIVAAAVAAVPFAADAGWLVLPLTGVQIWSAAVAAQTALLLLGLLAMRRIFLRPLRRFRRVMEHHRESPDAAGVLAAWPDDEVGVMAHEIAFFLRQFQNSRQQNQLLSRDLEYAQGRVRTVFDGLPLPIVLVDEQGRITQCNRTAGRLLGWKPQDALRNPLAVLVPEPFDPGRRNPEDVFRAIRDELMAQAREQGVAPLVQARSARGESVPLRLHMQEVAWHGRREFLCFFETDETQLEGYVIDSVPNIQSASIDAPAAGDQPVRAREVYDQVRKLLRAMSNVDVREVVDLSSLVQQVVETMGYDPTGPEAKVRILNPVHALARADSASLRFVLGEVLTYVIGASRPEQSVNIMITATGEAVGVLVETAVDAALDAPSAAGSVALSLAEDVLAALGGTLSLYTDIPGSIQAVVELPPATHEEAGAAPSGQ